MCGRQSRIELRPILPLTALASARRLSSAEDDDAEECEPLPSIPPLQLALSNSSRALLIGGRAHCQGALFLTVPCRDLNEFTAPKTSKSLLNPKRYAAFRLQLHVAFRYVNITVTATVVVVFLKNILCMFFKHSFTNYLFLLTERASFCSKLNHFSRDETKVRQRNGDHATRDNSSRIKPRVFYKYTDTSQDAGFYFVSFSIGLGKR